MMDSISLRRAGLAIALVAGCGGQPPHISTVPASHRSSEDNVLDFDPNRTVRTNLGELVRRQRPELVPQSAGPSTRYLSGAAAPRHASPVQKHLAELMLEARCEPGLCTETLHIKGTSKTWDAYELLQHKPTATDERAAIIAPEVPGAYVSGYVGASTTWHGAANSSNQLGCFSLEKATGKRLSIDDFDSKVDVVGTVSEIREQQRAQGLGDPLAGFVLDPRSIRIEHMPDGQSYRVVLCAKSATDVTEGEVIEIPVLEDVLPRSDCR